ncbi:glycosyl transferase [Gluconobacter frateurii M-2]|nr:glycosyl transferase [Gluconobacter frateurii M-2]
MPKPLIGYIDVCDRERVAGWAVDLEAADHPVRLHILMDGRLVDDIEADTFRVDLAGLPREGQCAFECVWPEPLPHEGCLIEILDSLLDRPVNGSPFYIEPLPSVLSGSVDKTDRLHIAGWVRDELNMERTVWLTAIIDGNPTTRFPANQFRRDLREAGLGSGRYGFDYVFSAALDPFKDHDIQLFHGQERFGSPIHIPQSQGLDDSFKRHFSTLMQSLTTDEARSDALSFLTSTADALRSESGGDIVRLKERGLKQRAARRQETAKPVAPCALFVDDRAPDPTFDAGSVALLSHIRAAQALGYDCSFIASRQPPSERDQHRLAKAGITCLMPPVFTGPEEALKRLGTGLEVVYLHRLNNAESYAALTRAFAPTATLVWNIADLASLRLRRQASIEHRPELDRVATHIAVRENMCAWISDHVLTHSPVEAELLKRVVPTADVHIVPWAVPVRPRPRQKTQKPIIAFVAHFGHAPNTDAAKWLVLNILPHLKKLVPDLVCRLIGSAMPHAVHMLAEKGVEIIGHVPNLEEALADVSLCVAPLRYGAGIKGKVLEAWSAGLPIIMTPIAAEGLIDSDDPVWRKAVADTDEDFAQKTAALLKPTAARAQVTAARKLLREHFSDAAIQNRLEDIFPPVTENMTPLPEDTSKQVLN